MTRATEGASGEALDALVESALDAFENEGDAGIERLYREQPHSATALRARVEALRAVGLLGARETGTPERLGGFKLLRPLGAGGMGIVYLALQEELGREVALKVIRPEHMFFPGARRRFRREVEIVARLQHPGIVPIHTVGEENGIPYFAMELLRGETLEVALARLRDRDPTTLSGSDLARDASDAGYLFAGSWEDTCLRVVRQVADALDHAHRQGVLHRDLKPSNVLVTSGASCRAVLLDFGLASSVQSGKLTRSGEQLGSLNYMPPEQLHGARELDPRSDVYALGATLYELLTLHMAFEGGADTEILRAIEHGTTRRIRELNPHISWEAETVCMAAMEHDPKRRYASAADFARDLDNVLARRPIEARRAGTLHRVRRWVERNPARAAALALALLLVVAVPSVYAWQQHRSAVAVGAQRDRAERNFERALSAVDRMLSRVGDVDLRFVPQMEPVRTAVLEDAIKLLEQFVADEAGDPRAERAVAEAHARLANLQADLGRNAEAAESFARAADVFGRLHAAAPQDLDLLHNWIVMRVRLATMRAQTGHSDEGFVEHDQLAGELERAIAGAPNDVGLRVDAITNLETHAHELQNAGRNAEALELFQRAEREAGELAERMPDQKAVLEVRYSTNDGLAGLLLKATPDGSGNAEVEAALERAILSAQRLAELDPQNPQRQVELAHARSNLGGAYRRAQQFDRALEEYEAARVIDEDVVARFPSTPAYKLELATVCNQLGLLREWRNQEEGVEDLYRRAVDLLGELVTLAPKEANLWDLYATAQVNLSAMVRHSDPAEAERMLVSALEANRRALALAPENFGFRHSLIFTVSAISIVRRENGNHAGAAEIVEATAREFPDDWKSWSNAAVQLAKLVEWVRDVGDFPDDERQRLIDRYVDHAVTMMRGAIEHGVPGTRDLHQLEDLQPLFGEAAFERFAREIQPVKE